MNKQRRAALNLLQDRLDAQKDIIATALTDMQAIADEIEALRDEEQDAYDSLAESFQNGERGEAMQEAIDKMTEAFEGIQSYTEDAEPENAISEAFAAIEDAKGQA